MKNGFFGQFDLCQRKSAVLLGAVLGLAILSTAHAQSSKPGLWEHSTTVKTGSGQLEQQMAQMQRELAAMPADQRKMMEQMMAQQGMSLPGMGQGGATAHRYCMTPEEAARSDIPSHDEDCKYTVLSRSANKLRMSFVCTDEGNTKGEGEVTFASSTAYSGKFTMTTRIDGKPERMEMSQTGKWLSADCGKIRPAGR
jgi:TolA-binding protein